METARLGCPSGLHPHGLSVPPVETGGAAAFRNGAGAGGAGSSQSADWSRAHGLRASGDVFQRNHAGDPSHDGSGTAGGWMDDQREAAEQARDTNSTCVVEFTEDSDTSGANQLNAVGHGSATQCTGVEGSGDRNSEEDDSGNSLRWSPSVESSSWPSPGPDATGTLQEGEDYREAEEEAQEGEGPDTLKIALLKERASVYTLRRQLSQLEEVAAMQTVNEAGTQAEITRLRGANSRLELKVGTLEETVARLGAERKQLRGRLAALQRAVQQLEREASIRTRVQMDLAAAIAPENAKGWLGGWGAKDPLAEAAALAEEARVQRAAAAATVEKLLLENADLADQLNEQSSFIERLVRSYGDLALRPPEDARKAPPAPQHPRQVAASHSSSHTESGAVEGPNGLGYLSANGGGDGGASVANEAGEERPEVCGREGPASPTGSDRQASLGSSGDATRGTGEGDASRADSGDTVQGHGPQPRPASQADSPSSDGNGEGEDLRNAATGTSAGSTHTAACREESGAGGPQERQRGGGPEARKDIQVTVPIFIPGSSVASPRQPAGSARLGGPPSKGDSFQNMAYSPREAVPGVRMGVVTSPRALAFPRGGAAWQSPSANGGKSGGSLEGGALPSPSPSKGSGGGLKHSPLVGAPFRLVSFLARFISGADLVERNLSRTVSGESLV